MEVVALVVSLIALVISATSLWHSASDMEWTLIFSVRNGRIFGVEYFWDYADALKAAGLSE
jgi:hypothetical protein